MTMYFFLKEFDSLTRYMNRSIFTGHRKVNFRQAIWKKIESVQFYVIVKVIHPVIRFQIAY